MSWDLVWPLGGIFGRSDSGDRPATARAKAKTGRKGDRPEWVRLCTKASWEADIISQWLQGYDIPVRKQDVGIAAYLGGGAATTLWVPRPALEDARELLDSEGVKLE